MDKVRKNKTAIFVFLFPSALLFLAIIILPIFMSGYYSLLDWDGITSGTFVGIQNYIELFTEKSLGLRPYRAKRLYLCRTFCLFTASPRPAFGSDFGKGHQG